MKISQKRFRKLLMAMGYDRNTANLVKELYSSKYKRGQRLKTVKRQILARTAKEPNVFNLIMALGGICNA